jgi:hypothetical protein
MWAFSALVVAQVKEPSKPGAKKKPASTAAKPAPAPTPSKTTAAPTKAPLPAPAKTTQSSQQLIVSVPAARVRSQPGTGAPEIKRVKLGSLYKIVEEKSGWYRIQLSTSAKPSSGWISNQVAGPYDQAKREEIYSRLIEKNFKNEGLSYVNASEIYEFITKVGPEIKSSKVAPDAGLKRLLSLSQALKAIPYDKDKESPYKSFLKTHEKEIVYSEPADSYFVDSELFWALLKKYPSAANADEIAWAGATNPLPGECEGYVVCYLFLLRQTSGQYLDLRPQGKYSAEALKNISDMLQVIISDLKDKTIYYGPTDVSDRAEFNRLIVELRGIVSRLMTTETDKQKVVQQLNQVAEGFR